MQAEVSWIMSLRLTQFLAPVLLAVRVICSAPSGKAREVDEGADEGASKASLTYDFGCLLAEM